MKREQGREACCSLQKDLSIKPQRVHWLRRARAAGFAWPPVAAAFSARAPASRAAGLHGDHWTTMCINPHCRLLNRYTAAAVNFETYWRHHTNHVMLHRSIHIMITYSAFSASAAPSAAASRSTSCTGGCSASIDTSAAGSSLGSSGSGSAAGSGSGTGGSSA